MSNHIKILLGGSPCTHWSIAQSKNRETEASGIGWELFENYLYARDKFKPDYFLYENNKSAAQPIKDQISKRLGVKLQYINSALVSAQNRQRFYGHNIPDVPQPQDRGILLRDVLESGVAWNEKAHCMDSNYYKGGNLTSFNKQSGQRLQVAEPVIFQTPRGFNKGGAKYDKAPTLSANGSWADNNKIIEQIKVGYVGNGGQGNRIYSVDGKAVAQTATSGGVGAKTGLYACPITKTEENAIKHFSTVKGYVPEMFNAYNLQEITDKSPTLSTGSMRTSSCAVSVICKYDGKTYPVYEVKDGLIEIKGKTYPIKLQDGYYIIRKLTVNECRRLQTIPDWYKMPCSASQNYKMLGNGWTIEVIKHILSHIPNIANCTIEVLSMYSGMNCDLITLTELGSKIVRCVDYEIDKYAIQTASANFPYIEHRGDAFQLRDVNWNY